MNYPAFLNKDDKDLYVFKNLTDWRRWYKEYYLKSKHWKWVYNHTLLFFDFRCIVCGNKATQAHHTKAGYLRLWHEIPGKHTLAVCSNCHKWINNKILPGNKIENIANDIIEIVDAEKLREIIAM